MESVDKVRENRARRAADRQGLVLVKSRRRDPLALDYQRYWLTDAVGGLVAGGEHGMTLDAIERELARGRGPARS